MLEGPNVDVTLYHEQLINCSICSKVLNRLIQMLKGVARAENEIIRHITFYFRMYVLIHYLQYIYANSPLLIYKESCWHAMHAYACIHTYIYAAALLQSVLPPLSDSEKEHLPT